MSILSVIFPKLCRDKCKTNFPPDLPDSIKPSKSQMQIWVEQGYVEHCPEKGEILCYQWVNWALKYLEYNYKIDIGHPPTAELGQILFNASKKYLEEEDE